MITISDVPHIKIYKVWNSKLKKFYFSSKKSIFSNIGHIKSSMDKPNAIDNIEDWYLITISSLSETTVQPLSVIYNT